MVSVLWTILLALWVSGPGIPVTASPATLHGSAIQQQVFVGSTPGDAAIKSRLGIPGVTAIDFIRWKLILDSAAHKTFVVQITYGEVQPNTLGFKNGGQSKTFRGKYTTYADKLRFGDAEIMQLQGTPFPEGLTLVRVNGNILQFLNPENQLMAGNGGWSYTLNRKLPTAPRIPPPNLKAMKGLPDKISAQTVYEGRTPCREIADVYQLKASGTCFKIKWKLTLNRDGQAAGPATYALRAVVDNSPLETSGSWTREMDKDSNTFFIQLQPEKKGNPLYLYVFDEKILLFMDPKGNLLVGNENFSYTLNRRDSIPEPAQ